METLDKIYFYCEYGDYGYMNNFFICNFVFDNITFSSSKQFFVYMKAKTFEPNNIELHKKIFEEKDPIKISNLGRQVENYSDLIWKNIKYEIMVQGLKLKFGQNLELKLKLLITGDKILYDCTDSNKMWNIGCNIFEICITNNYHDSNLLGKALVEVRNWLKIN